MIFSDVGRRASIFYSVPTLEVGENKIALNRTAPTWVKPFTAKIVSFRFRPKSKKVYSPFGRNRISPFLVTYPHFMR